MWCVIIYKIVLLAFAHCLNYKITTFKKLDSIVFHLCHVAVFTNNQIYFIKTVQCNLLCLLYYLI
jgi:hypothetical protein